MCSNGCTAEPTGTPDQCTGTKPTCSCYNGSGLYCATAAQNHGSSNNCSINAGTNADLLDCNGMWSVPTSCPNGCIVEPAGTPDQCAASALQPCP